MSLRRNIIFNYANQIYVAVVSVIMMPIYIRYMGPEAYGLVGFFAMLQAWFMLLDMGLTPTVARETARFKGGVVDVGHYRSLIRTLERIFIFVALVGGGGLFVASNYIANNWLQIKLLPLSEVQSSLHLTALIVALRWVCGLYRGIISGSERIIWLGGYNSFVATLRFVGVLVVLEFIGVTPTEFFGYQFVIAIVEIAGLYAKAHSLLPFVSESKIKSHVFKFPQNIFKFSLTIGSLSVIWISVTQIDKLVLSRILLLDQYGYFTIAVMLANGVTMMSVPISGAIMPRMARLEAQGNHEGMIRVYRQATQFVSIISGGAAIFLGFFSKELLWAWTGDEILAVHASPILTLYALGNGVLAISAFPYYMQFAKGDLRLHLIGQIAYIIVFAPAMLWAAENYGALGTGGVWLTVNTIYLAIWAPHVHRKLVPGLNLKWFFQDSLLILFAMASSGYILSGKISHDSPRGLQVMEMFGSGSLMLLVGLLTSSVVWSMVRSLIKKQSNRTIFRG